MKKLAICLLLALSWTALAQDKQQVDKINKWFDNYKPKEWQPKVGEIQKPGEIQTPKGIQAIKATEEPCQRRLTVYADTLFEFNKSTLSPDAEETLSALGPMIQKQAGQTLTIEGHTDGIGNQPYNVELGRKRALTVREWLDRNRFLSGFRTVQTVGIGKTRPIAPNTNPDGSDNPEGRQKNRRVELLIDTCR